MKKKRKQTRKPALRRVCKHSGRCFSKEFFERMLETEYDRGQEAAFWSAKELALKAGEKWWRLGRLDIAGELKALATKFDTQAQEALRAATKHNNRDLLSQALSAGKFPLPRGKNAGMPGVVIPGLFRVTDAPAPVS